MLYNLPQQYRKDPWVQALYRAIGTVIADIEQGEESLSKQLSLDSVTWNLETEERLAGIAPSSQTDLENRRAVLKGKWRSGGKLTIVQIQAVADAWKNGETAVSYQNSRIWVQFIGAYGVPSDMDALRQALQDVIPAHLPIAYAYRYLLIRDIQEQVTLSKMETFQLNLFTGD